MAESKDIILIDTPDTGSRGSSSGKDATHTHAEHGALIDHDMHPQAEILSARGDNLAWSRFRHKYRDYLSEFFGTFTLLLFGDGVVAQVVLSGGKNGDYQSISWGWG